MTALARPTALVSLLVSTAALLHPALRSGAWLPQRDAVLAALLLLTTIALGLRASAAAGGSRTAAGLLAAGVALAVGAAAGDGLRGHQGTLSLVPGQARSHFDETGPDGRALGLRPLGFTVGLEEVRPGGVALLAFSGEPEPVEVSRNEAVGHGGFHFARPRAVPTGAVSRLRLGISGGGQDQTVDVAPGRPARAGNLTVAVEEYFPDFALDDGQRPFTRSREPRNPGALLAVTGPQGTFRVFVLQALPGVHRVEALDRSFSLLGLQPEVSVEMAVHRAPLAGVALLGGLAALAGVVLGRRVS